MPASRLLQPSLVGSVLSSFLSWDIRDLDNDNDNDNDNNIWLDIEGLPSMVFLRPTSFLPGIFLLCIIMPSWGWAEDSKCCTTWLESALYSHRKTHRTMSLTKNVYVLEDTVGTFYTLILTYSVWMILWKTFVESRSRTSSWWSTSARVEFYTNWDSFVRRYFYISLL